MQLEFGLILQHSQIKSLKNYTGPRSLNFLHTYHTDTRAHSATQNDCHKGTTDTHLFGDLGP